VWLPNLHDSETAICSTEFMPFVPINKEWRPFLYELLKSQPVQSEISNRVTGSTGSRQRVKPRDIAVLPCIVPPEKLIEVFCQKVGSLHCKQHSNIKEIYSLGKIRDLLLPKLISGDLRVPDVESLLDTSINR
jgi:type I restriction enzyme, S subunit